jgi:hypothetical protein
MVGSVKRTARSNAMRFIRRKTVRRMKRRSFSTLVSRVEDIRSLHVPELRWACPALRSVLERSPILSSANFRNHAFCA